MTDLSLAVTNFLLQIPDIITDVGSSDSVGPWIFDSEPWASITNSSTCIIVVTEGNPHEVMATRKSIKFPTIVVDIWADSTRLPDLTYPVQDSTDKINALAKKITRELHFRHPSVFPGDPYYYGSPRHPRMFGTEEEIATRSGVVVLDSSADSGDVVISPVTDADGSEMGRLTFSMVIA